MGSRPKVIKMERLIFFLLFSLYFQDTSPHSSCCLTKKVGGKTYQHIADHGMDIPAECKNHCAYQEIGSTDGKIYCFGTGNLTTMCLAPGCPVVPDIYIPTVSEEEKKPLEVNTTAGALFYGPWSDERLSAFEVEVSLMEGGIGFAAVGFSPCFNCEPAYQFVFLLNNGTYAGGSVSFPVPPILPGQSVSGLLVNGKSKEGDYFDYNVDDNKPAKFLIQTFPLMNGQLRLTANFTNGLESKRIVDYTVKPGLDRATGTPFEDGIAPWGITYATFGFNDIGAAATYTFEDVDRLPEFFPIADCREGYNVGLTGDRVTRSVTIEQLNIQEPFGISNVDRSQKWCIIVSATDCTTICPIRNHAVGTGEEGIIINQGTCLYLKATSPGENSPGELSLTYSPDDATRFQFVIAPNTEISQLRFNNLKDVVSYMNMRDFYSPQNTKPVTKIGNETFPLISCFKPYKFLSNVA